MMTRKGGIIGMEEIKLGESMEMNHKHKLVLKSIKEIFNQNEFYFFIPDYQRGYRWGTLQVKQLLDDILTFLHTKTQNEFYPLQPIVVFKDDEEKRYEIIDGQQRLTTIYIIFKYLLNTIAEIKSKKEELEQLKDIIGYCFGNVDKLENKIPKLPNIEYQTRKESKKFLEEIGSNESNKIYDNPDFYYMNNAYNIIKKWFTTNNINLEMFIDVLLNNVKVIWYEIEESDEKEKRDIFTRLNIGKIELTNAELIRALLLNNVEDYKKQIEIGYELDRIEYSLRNPLFWSFLEEKERDTRIDLIYELLADTYKGELLGNNEKSMFDKSLDKKYSFYVFEYIIKSNKKTNFKIIEEIKEYFRFLEEWFEDKEFYHKIGYLLAIKHKNITLLKLIEKYKGNNKEKFRQYLNCLIKGSLKDKKDKNIDIDSLEYGQNNNEIRKVLLLFNIQTILDNENVTYKFDFSKFKSRKDDIEHIRSQTDPDIQGTKRKEWLKTIFKFFGKENKINKALEKYMDDNKFRRFYNLLSLKFKEKNIDDDLKNSIGNLTLLDSSVNRSYGNSFFPIKRAIILEADRKGIFIPPCTKNVFLKVYSKKINNMMEWDENDIKSHQEAIKKSLKGYLGEENE